MCLSTAYKNTKSPDAVMAKNITSIEFEGAEIVLIDLMGAEFRVEGSLKLVDLVNGTVIIETEVA